MEAPVRPHRRLKWKYTGVVVALVAAAVLSLGLTELYFSYQDTKRALTGVERDKAFTAAGALNRTDVPLTTLGSLAADVVAEAIVRGVRAAQSVDGWPGLKQK